MNLSLNSAEIKFVFIALVLGFITGAISGYWAVSIGFFLLLFIFWLLSQISRLHAWLDVNAPIDQTPTVSGATDKIVSNICTIKKENERQQKHLEEVITRFDAATSAMPDAMLIVDHDRNLEWSNSAAQRLLGIENERDIGHRIDNIIRDPAITSYLLNQDYAEPLECSSADSNENDLMLRIISYGEGRRLLCMHDHQDLLRLQQVRKAFIANASHEMRTPLTVIIGYLETLSTKQDLDEITRRGVTGSLEQAHRLKQLIEDLLSLSRLESLPLAKSKVKTSNLAKLTRESIELIQASSFYNQQQIELIVECDIDIRGDDRELSSAIQNIVENAVKYSPINTLVEIIINKTPDNKGELLVFDHGEGIEQAHLSRLAERFYRVDDGRSRDKGGTGLGLSIVKHVMDRHNGELIINSEVGKGTKVQLLFPSERTTVSESSL